MQQRETSPGGGTEIPLILRIRLGHPLDVIFLGRYRGHHEHWHGNEYTYPCDGPGCKNCLKTRIFYYAYVPVQYWDSAFRQWIPRVLQLTECAEQVLRGITLRGTIWSITRLPGKGKLGKVSPRYVANRPTAEIPDEFDVIPSLKVVMGDRQFRLDVPNVRVEVDEQPIYLGAPPPGQETRQPGPQKKNPIEEQRKEEMRARARGDHSNGRGPGM